MLAYLLIRRQKTFLALLAGLVIIAAFQVYLHLSLEFSIQDCLDRVCTSAGLSPGCRIGEFGCTEWSGLSVFLFYAAGIAQAIVLAVGSGIMIFLASRKKRCVPRPSEAL